MPLVRDIIQRGDTASQPLATTVPIGTLYFDTDSITLYRSNGTTWDSVEGVSAMPPLDDLSDVVITTPLNLEVLTYDTGSGTWINAPASASSGLSSAEVLNRVAFRA